MNHQHKIFNKNRDKQANQACLLVTSKHARKSRLPNWVETALFLGAHFSYTCLLIFTTIIYLFSVVSNPSPPTRTVSVQSTGVAPTPLITEEKFTTQETWRSLLKFFLGFTLLTGLVWVALTLPSSWWSQATPLIAAANSLEITRGKGLLIAAEKENSGETLVITGFDSQGSAVIAPKIESFAAEDYPLATWNMSPQGAQDVQMIWSNDRQPGKIFQQRFIPAENAKTHLNLSRHPNWQGRIVHLALLVHGPAGGYIKIRDVMLSPLDLPNLITVLREDWFSFIPWQASTINFWYGGSERPWLNWNATLLFCLLLSSSLWWGWRWAKNPDHTYAAALTSFLMLITVGWIVANAPWLNQQVQQVCSTWRIYGKSKQTVSLSQEEVDLQTYLAAITPLFKDPKARTFILSDLPYFTGKLAYALLPRPVYGNVQSKSVALGRYIQPGDYLAFFSREKVSYNPKENKIQLEDGTVLMVETLYFAGGNALFRVQDKQS